MSQFIGLSVVSLVFIVQFTLKATPSVPSIMYTPTDQPKAPPD